MQLGLQRRERALPGGDFELEGAEIATRRVEMGGLKGVGVGHSRPGFANRLKKLVSFHVGVSVRFAMRTARSRMTSTNVSAAGRSIGCCRSSDTACDRSAVHFRAISASGVFSMYPIFIASAGVPVRMKLY